MPKPFRVQDRLGSCPIYPLLIPSFFLLHGFARFLDLIPVYDLVIYYFIAAMIIVISVVIAKYFLGSYRKAAAIIGFISLAYFFFGDIQTAIKSIPGLGIIGRYQFLLSTFLIVISLLYVAIKQSKSTFRKLSIYLNLLFLLLCLYDLGVVLIGLRPDKQDVVNQTAMKDKCMQCKTPDIYLIILDEYAGVKTLKERFNYDNSAFTAFFRKYQFFTPENPKSNYSATAISVASLLTMDVIPWAVKHDSLIPEDHARAEKTMDTCQVVRLLKEYNYEFINHSIFNIAEQPSKFDPELLPTKLKLITAQTFANKFNKDLFGSIQANLGARFSWAERYHEDAFRNGNKKLIDLTTQTLARKSDHPKFVYTHLLMPHGPYVFDSLGRKVANKAFKDLTGGEEDSLYLSYLVYTNKVVTTFVDKIMTATKSNAVIMVMSDHGYRKNLKYIKSDVNDNFNAIYIPGKDYSLYYDTMSNMNQFRLLFNTLFRSDLKLKPDKSYF